MFSGATFTQGADFSEAKFEQEANFVNACFEGAADFRRAQFHGFAHFWLAQFSQSARFMEARFPVEAYFRNVTFKGAADFSLAVFTLVANFGETRFLRRVEFRETVFHEDGTSQPGPVFSHTHSERPETVNLYDVYLGQALFHNCDVSRFNFSDVRWRRRADRGKRMVFEEIVDRRNPNTVALRPEPESPNQLNYQLIASRVYRSLPLSRGAPLRRAFRRWPCARPPE